MNPLLSFPSDLRETIADSVLSDWKLKHPDLSIWLRDQFIQGSGADLSLMAEPVAKALFRYQTYPRTLSQLAAAGLLNPLLLKEVPKLLGGMPNELASPYSHQGLAWESLLANQPRATLLSAGTASGKTQAFMVPIVNTLVDQLSKRGVVDEGVQALILYPLNALIEDQQQRLTSYLRPFGGELRFSRWNGQTPEDVPNAEQARVPWEVLDRRGMRSRPASILITNITMLEYLLLRDADAPILAKSRGKLRYVVVDEAHNYQGAQAVELALLLKRVLDAFDVSPDDVRFSAFSATLGDRTKPEPLVEFLRNLSGRSDDRLDVIHDQPVPVTPTLSPGSRYFTWAQAFEGADNASVFLRDLAAIEGSPPTAFLAQLEEFSLEPPRGTGLSLRLNLFVKTLPGLYACSNSFCEAKPAVPSWPYGRFFSETQIHCPACGYPVGQVVRCDTCGEPHLSLMEDPDAAGKPHLTALPKPFYQLVGDEDLDDETEAKPGNLRLLGPPLPERTKYLASTGRVFETQGKGSPIAYDYYLDQDKQTQPICVSCGIRGIRHFAALRADEPFLLNLFPAEVLRVSAPEPDQEKAKLLPLGGRRALSFTDARQKTARYSLNARLDAERNWVRQWLVRTLVHGAKTPKVLINKLSAQLEQPPLRFLRDYYEPAVSKARDLASILVLRELGRRSRRGSNLESLGLVTLEFPELTVIPIPAVVSELHISDGDWRRFLTIFAKTRVRTNWWFDLDDWDEAVYLLQSYVTFNRNQPLLKGFGIDDCSMVNGATKKANQFGELLFGPDSAVVENPATHQRLMAAVFDGLAPLCNSDSPGLQRLDFLEQVSVRLLPEFSYGSGSGEIVAETLHGRHPMFGRGAVGTTPWGLDFIELCSIPRADLNPKTTDRLHELRQMGFWNRYQERIFFGTHSYVIQEHSAQIGAAELKVRNEGFRDGTINYLFCTTTMEMGVDIGELSAVVMNNVPPLPGNYQQRSGRAGRAGQKVSVALTLCPPRPLSLQIYQNPLSLLGPTPVPRVQFLSREVVFRQFRALALGLWIRSAHTVDPWKSVGQFFVSEIPGAPSRSEAFLIWLQAPPIEALDRLTAFLAGTPFEADSSFALVRAHDLMSAVAGEWKDIVERVEQEIRVAIQEGRARAATALGFKLGSLKGENLIGHLCRQLFLPTYGFPTRVVELELPKKYYSGSGANGGSSFRGGSGPSRSTSMAIREYAPSASVLVDQHNFRVAGVIPKRRYRDSGAKQQVVNQLWYCTHCGAAGDDYLPNCPNCLKPVDAVRFLEPQAFSVDEEFPLVPLEEDSQRGQIEVRPLLPSDPKAAVVYADTSGKLELDFYKDGTARVFQANRGQGAGRRYNGFVYCNRCHRAELRTSGTAWRDSFTLNNAGRHYDLQHSRKFCGAVETDLTQGLALGFVMKTDVLLLKAPTLWGHDEVKAWTVGAVLRDVLARELSIVTDDLGLEILTWEGQQVIILYDSQEGGAGLVAQVPERLSVLWTQALRLLACRDSTDQGCDLVCHHCLLSYQTQHLADQGLLDRKKGLEALKTLPNGPHFD